MTKNRRKHVSIKLELCIKPVEFNRNYEDLLRVGSILVENLQPYIGRYYITKPIKLSELQKCVENDVDYFQSRYALKEFPKYERFGLPYKFDTLLTEHGIIAEHFILSLDRYVIPKTILLCITSVPCYYSFNKCYVYGMGDKKLQQLAFISIGYPEFMDIDIDIFIQKVIAHGMHEIGHALGLGHHSPYPDKSGKFCPMAKITKEYLSKKGISLDHYDLYRRSTFCKNCSKQLKLDLNQTLNNYRGES
jgi:predicted Zn-dependent protease